MPTTCTAASGTIEAPSTSCVHSQAENLKERRRTTAHSASEKWISSAAADATTSATYDNVGNTLTDTDEVGGVTQYIYDTSKLFVVEKRLPKYSGTGADTRFKELTQWLAACEKPSQVTDINSQVTTFDYDTFCRPKATLKPGAREKLAKVSGILVTHPDLKIEIEGHTDSVGSDSYNQGLSERRAESVRGYLVSQRIAPQTITTVGFGESRPVATNDTAAGRQQNRRVELVVSGEAIGTH